MTWKSLVKEIPELLALGDYMVALDQLLTCRSYEECLRMFRSQEDNIEDILFGKEYYLSDGGYSRIYFNPTDFSISLTQNSLEGVRSMFESRDSVGSLNVGLLEEYEKVLHAYGSKI